MVNSNQQIAFAENSFVTRATRKVITPEIFKSRYSVKLAQTQTEIESALRLRYEVFNVELAVSNAFGANDMEFDCYDVVCQHLIVVDNLTGQTVGTYRLNSIQSAHAVNGFYAYNEFSLEDLPNAVLNQAVEIGRACIAREYRNSKVLFLLWKCLLDYLRDSQKRYFFGCCSLFTRDYEVGVEAFRRFERDGFVHPKIKLQPRPNRAFSVGERSSESAPIELPALFNLYLKMGVKICGAPAVDLEFGTIDFFVLFDLREMNERCRKLFFR